MIEVAEIFRQHAAAYLSRHCLPAHQRRAMRDIEHCRTAFFGGHVAQCDHCGALRYAYHSCRNRHCPKCHGEQTAAWLQKQESRLLACPHYFLTFTLPAALRPTARCCPTVVYNALLRCAAAALQALALDPQYMGGTPAVIAVLHTWTRALVYHPHVHLLVSAGGLAPGGQHWVVARHPAFLVPVRALSILFRAKMRAALKRSSLLAQTPPEIWKQPWVVHCQYAGAGEKVLGYLARYAFRVAITNSRLESFHDGEVTFRYRDNRTHQHRRLTLNAEQFIDRFVQHILPRGFPKVRYYGLASACQKSAREQARMLIVPVQTLVPNHDTIANQPPSINNRFSGLPLCPHCKIGHFIVIQTLHPNDVFRPDDNLPIHSQSLGHSPMSNRASTAPANLLA